MASTKEHQHYRKEYIRDEVNDMAAFKVEAAAKERREDATKHLEIDTAYDQDALAQARKNIEISKGIKEGTLDPNVYRGLHGYQNYFEQTEEDLRKKKFSGTLGPVRAPTFIRNTTRVDYNPERCKDWYETGRCNFGDSCVFIHDRSDYKSGWQLDQEFEAEQKRKHLKMMGHEVDDEEENYEIHSQEDVDGDGLPNLCRICEGSFQNPVVTACGHYFCERCALTHYSKSGDCIQCGKATNGIFNEAPKLIAKISQQAKKTQKQEEQGSDGVEIEGSSENDEERDNATTNVATGVRANDESDYSSDDNQGVLSKQDRQVFAEYREKANEVNKKKYQSQTGWFIP